jgi:hypothetical protein
MITHLVINHPCRSPDMRPGSLLGPTVSGKSTPPGRIGAPS